MTPDDGGKGATEAGGTDVSFSSADEASALRTDEELMLGYQRGDRAAFEELYERYAKPIYNFFRRAAHPEGPEDLLQRTFLKLHIARHRYQPTGLFRAWIFTLARNVLRDEARRRARRPRALDEFDERTQKADAPGEEEGRAEAAILMSEALTALPLTQREVIILSRYHGMSYAEIGGLLGIAENAVKQRAFQAMRKLRTYLAAPRQRE